jgi:hypothetical protein
MGNSQEKTVYNDDDSGANCVTDETEWNVE